MKMSLCATAKKNNKKIQANANAEKRFDASDLRVSDLLSLSLIVTTHAIPLWSQSTNREAHCSPYHD